MFFPKHVLGFNNHDIFVGLCFELFMRLYNYKEPTTGIELTQNEILKHYNQIQYLIFEIYCLYSMVVEFWNSLWYKKDSETKFTNSLVQTFDFFAPFRYA